MRVLDLSSEALNIEHDLDRCVLDISIGACNGWYGSAHY